MRREERKELSEVTGPTNTVPSLEEFEEDRALNADLIRSLNEKATTWTRQKWLELQPQHEQTIVQCETCQENLRELSWVTDNPHGFGYFQPVYRECSSHRDLFVQWVIDITRAMNYLYQRQ